MFPPVPAGAHPVAAQLQSRAGESERHRLGGKRVQEGRHVRSGDQRHDHEQSEQRNACLTEFKARRRVVKLWLSAAPRR